MTTHENFQQTTSEDADYFVNGRENLWNQLSSELDISNTLGRRDAPGAPPQASAVSSCLLIHLHRRYGSVADHQERS